MSVIWSTSHPQTAFQPERNGNKPWDGQGTLLLTWKDAWGPGWGEGAGSERNPAMPGRRGSNCSSPKDSSSHLGSPYIRHTTTDWNQVHVWEVRCQWRENFFFKGRLKSEKNIICQKRDLCSQKATLYPKSLPQNSFWSLAFRISRYAFSLIRIGSRQNSEVSEMSIEPHPNNTLR